MIVQIYLKWQFVITWVTTNKAHKLVNYAIKTRVTRFILRTLHVATALTCGMLNNQNHLLIFITLPYTPIFALILMIVVSSIMAVAITIVIITTTAIMEVRKIIQIIMHRITQVAKDHLQMEVLLLQQL